MPRLNSLFRSLIRWFRVAGWRDVLLPVVLYSIAACAITWPLVTKLTTHVAGPEFGDHFEYMRLGWWAKYALQHGLNPFYQSLFGYPEGFFSATQWSQPLIYWPIAVLNLFVNPPAAFNLWLMAELVLNGLTTYWLCREVLRKPAGEAGQITLPALFGGLIFTAYPAMQGHLIGGHVNPLAYYPVPILLIALLRIVEGRGTWRTAVMGALALWGLMLANFTAPAYVVLPILLYGGGYWLLFRRKDLLRRTVIGQLVICFGLGALLIAPFYLPLFQDISATSNRQEYLNRGGWVFYSTDPLAFVSPSPFTEWSYKVAPSFAADVLGVRFMEGTAYPGVVALCFALLAIWRRPKKIGLWLVMLLGCMFFSLGPIFKWNNNILQYSLGEDITTNIVTPYGLFQKLPFISTTRTPGRFNQTAGLMLAVLVALGVEATLLPISKFITKVSRKTLATLGGSAALPLVSGKPLVWLVAIALGVFVWFEYEFIFPFPITPADVPTYFKQLKDRPDVRAVLVMPYDHFFAMKFALNQQVYHEKSLIAGHVSRTTQADPARVKLLQDAAAGYVITPETDSQIPSTDTLRTLLKTSGADVLVYHWYANALNQSTTIPWANRHFGKAVYGDSDLTIYEVPPAEHVGSQALVTLSQRGWWRRYTNVDPWMSDEGSLFVYVHEAQDRRWSLTFSGFITARNLEVYLDDKLIGTWRIERGKPTPVDFWLKLTPGYHTLRFRLPEGCTKVPVAPTCLVGGDVDDASCKLSDADWEKNLCVGVTLNGVKSTPADAMAQQSSMIRLFGSGTDMTLLSFRKPAETSPGSIMTVETTWQAAGKPIGDLHMFLHVLDSSGKNVAQYDAVPGRGSFPTSKWAERQYWNELATFTLPNTLPPGTYSLYAGWYSFPDLARLKVDSSSPHAQEGLVYLGDVKIVASPIK